MTFTFTKAHAQMVSRLLELDYEDYKEELKEPEYHGSYTHIQYSKDIEVNRFARIISKHERDCGHEGVIDFDEECECTREYGLCLRIDTKIGRLGVPRKTLFEVIMLMNTPLHELISKVNAYAGKVYHTCSCGSLTVDGKSQCRECYIYSYERTDEEGGSCAICYENGGLWGQINHCKHTFHSHCLNKCEKKCPLCRHEFEMYHNTPNGVIINPYM
jgi:hypothetical protein